jgi:hypothetical protein
MIRLQRITSGFLCSKSTEFDEEGDLLPNKITWLGKTNTKLERLYTDLEECAKPARILTRFTAEASRIYEDLKGKYQTCPMTGWLTEGTIEVFKLQNAHVVLDYSNTFSLENRIQSSGRIWRLGQKNKCLSTMSTRRRYTKRL